MNIEAERKVFELVHPVPEGVEWKESIKSYGCDYAFQVQTRNNHNALWQGWLSKAEQDKDAERYRHMRASARFKDRNGPGLYWYLPRHGIGDESEQLDASIDASIDAAIANREPT